MSHTFTSGTHVHYHRSANCLSAQQDSKNANGVLVELHVDTETGMFFPEAVFVKEIRARWHNSREHNKRPLPAHLPILPLDECWVDGLHSDGYAWKREKGKKKGGRLSDTHLHLQRRSREQCTEGMERQRHGLFPAYREKKKMCFNVQKAANKTYTVFQSCSAFAT